MKNLENKNKKRYGCKAKTLDYNQQRKHDRNDNRSKSSSGDYWIFGNHAVQCALANDKRVIKRILLTKNASNHISDDLLVGQTRAEIVERKYIDDIIGEDMVHQGMTILTKPLANIKIEEIIESASDKSRILILDQITDPHNVGAILRSAAIFGADAIILQDRNAPQESGILAKSASGALEEVPLIRVGNLARSIDYLKQHDFWIVGFSGDAELTLGINKIGNNKTDTKLALVMGAEGSGMRRLTQEKCDILLKISMCENNVGSLNVSNAAAVALFATSNLD